MKRIGIDLGGTKTIYGLFDENMRIKDRLRVNTERLATPAQVMDGIEQDLDKLLRRNKCSMKEITGIGIGFPGHICYDDGLVLMATNLPKWENVPLREALTARLGVPVWVDNDTNCAALAEHRQGAGRGAPHMVYVTVSTGIGCGLIINESLFRGTHGFAGELGQIFVSDMHGYGSERTNAGVVQSIASGPQLERLARESIALGINSSIVTHAHTLDAIRCEHIGMALEDNDALALQIIDHASKYLGRMLVNLFELLDIGVIVYGGGVMKLGPKLRNSMLQMFFSLSHGARRCKVEFREPLLGDDAGLIGAAMIAGDNDPL